MTSSPFRLTKWYLDCVTAAGDVVIVYIGVLRWKGISLACNSFLTASAGRVEQRTALARAQVSADTEQVEIRVKKMDLEGRWRRVGPQFRTRVFESEFGFIDWDCVQTGSDVRVCYGERVFEGCGYAECLTMTAPPWRLPMKQLRWGRFVSGDHALAWIDWQGEFSNSFAVLDGRRIGLVAASEEEVVAEGAQLRLSASLPLRRGRLGATVLPSAPRLRQLLPSSLSGIEEHKWRSRGELVCGGQGSTGWVIHEVVHWTR